VNLTEVIENDNINVFNSIVNPLRKGESAIQLGKIFIVSKEEEPKEKILVRIYHALNP
jgi:hypothetical protein